MASQARELLLQWEAKPKPQKLCRGPHGEVPRGPTQDTPGCCDALGYVPGRRKWIWLSFTLCPPLEKGAGAPRPACTPPSPLPLLKRKEEPKMKLKHNSIRSGSRVKSSALIVCWQALPALQQTQCYQGTEGRFVCTGRASCCVRPACPGPREHRDARPRTGAAGGSWRQAVLWQHRQGAQPRDGVLWLGAASRLPV